MLTQYKRLIQSKNQLNRCLLFKVINVVNTQFSQSNVTVPPYFSAIDFIFIIPYPCIPIFSEDKLLTSLFFLTPFVIIIKICSPFIVIRTFIVLSCASSNSSHASIELSIAFPNSIARSTPETLKLRMFLYSNLISTPRSAASPDLQFIIVSITLKQPVSERISFLNSVMILANGFSLLQMRR